MLKFIINIFLIINFVYINLNSKKIIINSSKNNYLNLYIITHKDFNNFITNQNYKILCDDYYQLKKNYTLNILNSKNKNELFKKKIGYSEGSKIYFIWKKYKNNLIKSKFVGFNHYRRIFNFGNKIPNLNLIFKKYDVILNKRRKLKYTIKRQYFYSHKRDDLNEILEIIKKKFPKYFPTALKTMNSKRFFVNNIFIMKSKDFIEYGNFVFEILKEFDKKHNLITDENIKNFIFKTKRSKYRIRYQRRLEGFLLERISNIFYNYHFKKILQIKTKSFNKNPLNNYKK